jgi:hypothetical protein
MALIVDRLFAAANTISPDHHGTRTASAGSNF